MEYGRLKCWAYLDNGNICGKPATALDPVRGCVVCQDHLPLYQPPLPIGGA